VAGINEDVLEAVCIIDELLSHILSYVKKKSEEENTEKC